jgi:GTP-binding protein
MKFVDYVTITVRSGSGGPGCIAFRREKHVPRGGPAGGDGGRGGSVLLEADASLYTLLDLRYQRHHFAPNGQPGSGSNKTGKDGDDLIIRVPPGTVARNRETDRIIGELIEPGDRVEVAAGGQGGRGNAFFKTATRQTPRFAQDGEAGIELEVALELKLLADVGLVGFPNAGKSTLISSLSEARPKIADYPFTTLTPQLGVVRLEEYKSFVMADIPGIIEGAHEGRGLGIQFLKHIERNAVLLFVIPADSDDPVADYRTLLAELRAFNADLATKPRVVGLSKLDLIPPGDREDALSTFGPIRDECVTVSFSAVARLGLEELKRTLWGLIDRENDSL